ncbi:Copia protein [Eumeta japonica]|uniref:Copia protein n=1 Tax=Eumeta variegata TaxID=151549 RepID=A0A4C2A591_EUMVA|nr:Copia protein [Eumeta japonica]
MDETLIKTTVSESDDSLLSCNNDDPTYEPSQEIEDIMSHRNITLRPRNNRRFEANLVELSLPQTYDEALQSPQKYEWSQAIKEELSAHKENNTWNAVPRAGQRTLTTKWVFTIKKGENNEARYKARLCARGFTQIKDVDYQEIFSPTTRYDSIRIILSIAAKHKLEIQQFDVKTAFLMGIFKKIFL